MEPSGESWALSASRPEAGRLPPPPVIAGISVLHLGLAPPASAPTAALTSGGSCSAPAARSSERSMQGLFRGCSRCLSSSPGTSGEMSRLHSHACHTFREN